MLDEARNRPQSAHRPRGCLPQVTLLLSLQVTPRDSSDPVRGSREDLEDLALSRISRLTPTRHSCYKQCLPCVSAWRVVALR